jgi:hypothetical protein
LRSALRNGLGKFSRRRRKTFAQVRRLGPHSGRLAFHQLSVLNGDIASSYLILDLQTVHFVFEHRLLYLAVLVFSLALLFLNLCRPAGLKTSDELSGEVFHSSLPYLRESPLADEKAQHAAQAIHRPCGCTIRQHGLGTGTVAQERARAIEVLILQLSFQ